MSRTIVELEANTNPSESIRNTLTSYLKKYDGWAIDIRVDHTEGKYFEVTIKARKEGEWAPMKVFSLENVPIIKEYLLKTEALQVAYNQLAEVLDHQKKEAHIYLFGE